MSDLLAGRASLEAFQGIVFVGGFSYADVMDSGARVAWALQCPGAAKVLGSWCNSAHVLPIHLALLHSCSKCWMQPPRPHPAAKGWAGTIRFNDRLWQQFQVFRARPDTWSLGVCNGCQLMALLGWVPATGAAADTGLLPDAEQPRFVHNASGRFESRWVMVGVEEDSPAVMLRGMGGARIGVWCAHGEVSGGLWGQGTWVRRGVEICISTLAGSV